MKRFLVLLLCLLMLLTLIPTALAATPEAETAADTLYAMGLFQGTGTDANGMPIYALDKAPTRHEAVTMLVRLLGKEPEALDGDWDLPFTDVASWAEPYVGYAYANGLTKGIGNGKFGGETVIKTSEYLTFVLRALGYTSGDDFQWDKAWELSDELGLTDGQYNSNTAKFLRGDVAIISANAMNICCKGTKTPLADKVREATGVKEEFDAMMAQFNAEHREMVTSKEAFSDFSKYMVNDPATADLLSQAEIDSLVNANNWKNVLTYAEAASDVDLLFRAFKSAYGAYYYFGEEAFAEAKAEIMAWLNGKTTINTHQLSQVMGNAFDFLRDAHAYVGERSYEYNIRYEYYFCTGQNYSRDDTGYYKTISGEKWYFKSFSDNRVKMEPTMTQSGALAYSPVLFCPAPQMSNSTVTLQNAADQTKVQNLTWRLSEEYAFSYRYPDFRLLEENGIAYISERCFDYSFKDGELTEFVSSGAQVKDADVIIFDIRANGGGSDHFCRDWVKNYCGVLPENGGTLAFGYYHSALEKAANTKKGYGYRDGTNGTFSYGVYPGKHISNNIPIIVLVDDMCGSSGESMLNILRTLDNVMIVGSNSAGYQLCGNVNSYTLPNSGILFQFGSSPEFNYAPENVDFKGYEPDIWCNPKTALNKVLNMVIRYDLADADDVWCLQNQIVSPNPKNLNVTLDYHGYNIQPGGGFGAGGGMHSIVVLVDGKPATDFTVSSENPDVCTVEKKSSNTFQVNVTGKGDSILTVQVDETTRTFRWYAG